MINPITLIAMITIRSDHTNHLIRLIIVNTIRSKPHATPFAQQLAGFPC